MAATYLSAGALAASASTTTLSVSFPATVAANDLCILFVSATASSITMPAAFTAESLFNPGLGQIYRMGYKICAGTEGGTSVTVTVSAGSEVCAQIYRFSGNITAGTPYEGYATSGGSETGDAHLTTPAVTSTVANTLGVLIGHAQGLVTFTAASGYTERVDNNTGTGVVGNSLTVDTIAKATAGTTAAGFILASASFGNPFGVFGFAIKPPAGDTLDGKRLRFM